jgi:hypothetical protein
MIVAHILGERLSENMGRNRAGSTASNQCTASISLL